MANQYGHTATVQRCQLDDTQEYCYFAIMYVLKPGIKKHPDLRWALPDRIFYGHGACHILAGVFLQRYPESRYWAIWIKPRENYHGNHIFVTNGKIAFDYHGYSVLERLLIHHKKCWSSRFTGWSADIMRVDFPLLDTAELNSRNMRGPNQYFGDVIDRTNRYLDRVDHERQKAQASALFYSSSNTFQINSNVSE
ncbi:MAG: hypothetical protein KTR18_12820 [Acidiferrobacterales bacterium]|nr:hypothetical protein [Acidiferrobacterales bacterium]